MSYHPFTEDIKNLLSQKIGINEDHYFRVLATTYLAFISNSLHVQLRLPEGDEIPINVYSLLLASSGFGKTSSVNYLNEIIFNPFMEEYLTKIRKPLALKTIKQQAKNLALKHPATFEDIHEELMDLYQKPFPNKFESATSAAIRLQTDIVKATGSGAINLIIDEISSNITTTQEALVSFLPLYDRGFSEIKIIKGSRENKASLPLTGFTPSNLLAFGNYAKLLDGSVSQDIFYSLLDTGYARRLICAYVDTVSKQRLTPEEMLAKAKQISKEGTQNKITKHIESLINKGGVKLVGKVITMSDDAALLLYEHQNACDDAAQYISDYETTKKSELQNRWYKIAKIAGLYAFIDGLDEVTPDYISYAINLVNDCGEHFLKLCTPEPAHVKLLNYLLQVGSKQSFHEISVNLPLFANKSQSGKEDLLRMANSACPSYDCILQRTVISGVDYLSATKLEISNPDNTIFSISSHKAYNFNRYTRPFSDLIKALSNVKDDSERYFTTHHFIKHHRSNENAIQGCNLLVLDVDGTATIDEAKSYFEGYQYFLYTTKRHTETEHRFRLVFPLSHKVYLTPEEYSEFMENIFEDLPIEVDDSTKDIARLWSVYPASTTQSFSNLSGSLWPVSKYIPHSKAFVEKAELNKKLTEANLDRLERWFVSQGYDGNRNNTLAKYAFLLRDQAFDPQSIKEKVLLMNSLFEEPISQARIESTVFKSIH